MQRRSHHEPYEEGLDRGVEGERGDEMTDRDIGGVEGSTTDRNTGNPVTTYPEMNCKVVELLEMSDDVLNLYAAARIRELEEALIRIADWALILVKEELRDAEMVIEACKTCGKPKLTPVGVATKSEEEG